MRLNGIGVTFLSISEMDEQNVATATMWFTFLYLPVAPLYRCQVRFLPSDGGGFSYEKLERVSLNGREVAETYLYGWLLYPLAILGPMAIAVIEVWEALNLPESWHIPYAVATIIWLVVWAWKLSDWHEARMTSPLREE